MRERARPDIRIYSDEIYEHITFDGEHVSMSSLPGMAERTIIASGHSKGYAMTGWRLGWCVLPTAERGAPLQTDQHQHRELCSAVHPGSRPRGARKPEDGRRGQRHGRGVPPPSGLCGSRPQRDSRHPLRQPAGGVLCVPEHFGRLPIAGRDRLLRLASRFHESEDQPRHPRLPLPPVFPRRCAGGPAQFRA